MSRPSGSSPEAPLRIGELARRTGRSVHAIRWYETQGLVPGVARDGAGRRFYHERHVDWLGLMDRLRATGMSIAQMRRYTALVVQGRATLAARREMLLAHRTQVEQRIVEWQQALKLLDAKLDFYGDWIASGRRPR
jgi:DNA-binding transcriptional MerR regulator